MVLKDTNGTVVFTVTPNKKGTDTLGTVKRAGEDKTALTIKEGDTFYLVSDSLPEVYGGEGTDILLNMGLTKEKALSTVRISFGKIHSLKDIETVANAIHQILIQQSEKFITHEG